ncbi:MAG: hypothetical protein QXP98_05120 [Thermoproteus sp.]
MAQKLRFYNIKTRQTLETDAYQVVEKDTPKGVVIFAVATSPYTGAKIWRIVAKKQ